MPATHCIPVYAVQLVNVYKLIQPHSFDNLCNYSNYILSLAQL